MLEDVNVEYVRMCVLNKFEFWMNLSKDSREKENVTYAQNVRKHVHIAQLTLHSILNRTLSEFSSHLLPLCSCFNCSCFVLLIVSTHRAV